MGHTYENFGVSTPILRDQLDGVYGTRWYVDLKEDHGAVGDARSFSDAAITASDTTLTSATAAFTTDDIGRTVAVTGAGTAGAVLITTIASRNSSSSVELAAAAATTVSDAWACVGTDDTAAVQNAKSAAVTAGLALYIPPGAYIHTSNITVDGPLTIFGHSPEDSHLYAVGCTKAIRATGNTDIWVQELQLHSFGSTDGIVYEWEGETTSWRQGARGVNVRRFTGGGFVCHNGELFLFDGCWASSCGVGFSYDVDANSGETAGITCTWRRCRAIDCTGRGFDIDELNHSIFESCQALRCNTSGQPMFRLGATTTGITVTNLDVEDSDAANNRTGIQTFGSFHTLGPITAYKLATGLNVGSSRSVVRAGNRFESCTNDIVIASAGLNNVVEDAESGLFDPVVVTADPLAVTGTRRHLRNGISGQVVATDIDVTIPMGVEILLVDATDDARTVTLQAHNRGRRFRVVKTDASANAVTVEDAAEATVTTLASEGDTALVVSDGTTWHVLP